MKIAFFEIKGWEKPYLKKYLKGHELKFVKEPLKKDNIQEAKGFDIVSVFIYSKVDKNVLAALPKLKGITTRSTGFDHIDIKTAKKKGVAVCNVPTYGANTVAEHTFALILALSRNVHKSYVRGLKGDYSIEGLKGFDIKGKTLGVIGTGHIGLHVIKIARGFGMKVLAYDIKQHGFVQECLGFRYASLDELLSGCDIISLNCPENKDTHHLINKKSIKKIKKGAFLINTARGGLVDNDALIEALDKGILAGAGLDVIEGEDLIKEEKQLLYDEKKSEAMAELVKDHILLSRDDVVFTPHIAFYSREALLRIIETTAQNIRCFAEKSGMCNRVC
ncbi:hydroxyacid dehydrogenase [Candidatus Falkowbacteria bacterium]|nr:hydroxyacid dehydrogenase [Candidatus Falkowbacteria bacterium]